MVRRSLSFAAASSVVSPVIASGVLAVIACERSAAASYDGSEARSGSTGAVVASAAAHPAASHPMRSGVTDTTGTPPRAVQGGTRTPNEMGRIPILMYHIVGDHESAWQRTREHFAQDLDLLYARGYRPITATQLVDKRIDLPRGLSPVVVTFDDASPSQFRYVERNGTLEVDPESALGLWLAFHQRHPDWANRAVFCMLPAASAGHAFFGDRNVEGQRTAWRFRKLRFLATEGFELCGHTLWHANLRKYDDAVVQEQIARGVLAIDSAVPNYRVRSFALPLGIWPKNRALAKGGAWRDPKSGAVIRYDFDAIFEVWGHAVPSPYDPKFNPLSLQRLQVTGNALEHELDMLDRSGQRYVSAGKP